MIIIFIAALALIIQVHHTTYASNVSSLAVVALAKVNNHNRGFSCTGALLNTRIIITAKHCVQHPNKTQPQPATDIKVEVIGEILMRQLEVEQIVALDGVFNYDLSGELLGRDIALLILKKNLPKKLNSFDIPPEELMSTEFLVAKLQPQDSGQFKEIYSEVEIIDRDSHQIYTAPVTCGGDSGAPLISIHGELIGIASMKSTGPCRSGVSIFTSLYPHLDFINSILKKFR